MGLKRPREETMGENKAEKREKPDQATSPFMPMFENFRKELDEHHDRRERIIKASRDITASSKKIIFTLQRVRKLGQPMPQFVVKGNAQYWETIEKQYQSISADVQGLNAFRYGSNITGGNQEFMEALSFQHYLENQTLVSYEEAKSKIASMSGAGGAVLLTPEDYILGIFDMVGELMRFSITTMATNGKLPAGEPKTAGTSNRDSHEDKMDVDQQPPVTVSDGEPRNVLSDLRALRLQLEMFEPSGGRFESDVRKKADVMRECVDKVEKALYGLMVRGTERPKGWVPGLREEKRAEVESH
ncbi:unnamed protein product [Periconia digitata]|uniref:Translin n=1 Tax=Periconia digitata TaxID=1303443 RepID=A0A9W4UJI5_9PLEO|nr:unnamed protein product [Periconia digitata]